MNKMNKVAEITLYFWIMTILASTLGETSGDMLPMTMNLGYAESFLITFSIFIVLLIIQLKAVKFSPILYWSVIIGTTTVGTEVSDFMDRTLGLGYILGSLILFSGLLIILSTWYFREGKLTIYPIKTIKIEMFYWIAILFSNSLGTAFGDFLSDNIGLSYIDGAFVTASIIVAVIILHYFTRINQILLFWIAFIFTRPFGATFGDFLTKPIVKGGLNVGTFYASLVTVSLLMMVLIYSQRMKIIPVVKRIKRKNKIDKFKLNKL